MDCLRAPVAASRQDATLWRLAPVAAPLTLAETQRTALQRPRGGDGRLGSDGVGRRAGRLRLHRAIIALALLAALPSAAGDAVRGATLFQACAACHSTTPGQQMTGPSLAGVLHRKAGTVEGFERYSEAMRRASVVWNEETLDKWLTDPAAFIHGTTMTFPGLRDRRSRQDVIAYLEAVAEGKVPTAAQGNAGSMMGMPSAKVDLKNAPPQGQVSAIAHCRDTYTVITADGRLDLVWEFNLRFKTDSSALGPRPGKPVIVGAGMQGDRASIVFARPTEISAFIRESCSEP